MASPTDQRGQVIVELLIAASVLIAVFYLAFEVTEIALSEQKRYQFTDSNKVRRRQR